MPQLSTGAVHIFIAKPTLKPYFGNGPLPTGIPIYFGTCESMPQDQRQPEYEMLMNDSTGSKVPLDVAWEGESAQISLVMTRTNQALVESIMAHPSGSLPPGAWSFNDAGALMGLEGLAWQVWLVYQFGAALGAKAAYTSQGLRPGRRYAQCVLWAPQSEETGTKPMKQHFMFYAWPYADYTNKRFVLYDYNMAGISLASIS
jgi:hypothetical protein